MSRIIKEYKTIQKQLNNNRNNQDDEFNNIIVSLAPIDPDQDLTKWEAVIKGPQGTPYYGFNFILYITIPQEYPTVPPFFEFQPRSMPHCNVNYNTGEICLDILKQDHWTPVWNLMSTLKAIWLLLKDPVPESPLNVDLANLLRFGDLSAYNGLINYYLNINVV
ncbi:E2 ubiquitin-protein ligase peroxin 4 NDAI_0G00910 [Naumovozyma dairenensis CBS 421]|uniref:UBC core domain-containing protein n=1 Tax=Naumovozyma dairenensis (strain ATCC 10597 / BCRC 20456 / CBS 421 / NBRC 0211 / NRRL Y-12639) TaxID=1071378 RepID=G0WDK6_NAUDC|nr:hypothetical protein NDAI_0G00910 [Naumovozyma dairenensis CBS 421]CCD25867.2 hypothetical protein NDAI_0G00910 [Naumovozyma dairenensis CBS 421]